MAIISSLGGVSLASDYDVVVVGAGNAALCAAIAAREQGSSVLMLEKAPDYFRGGNTYFHRRHHPVPLRGH